YIEELVPPGETGKGVLIVDRRNPEREQDIFGKVAFIVTDEEKQTINFKLYEGTVYERQPKKPGFSRTRFNTYDFRLDPEDILGPTRQKVPVPEGLPYHRFPRASVVKRAEG